MTLTLLLDLDDTLLTNNMEAFLPAYFRALASYMTPHALPRDFIATLTASAGAMIANDFPNRTLKETFAKYPNIGPLLPAMGYSQKQIKDLEKTINDTECDLVVSATPIDLLQLVSINKPFVRVQYEYKDNSQPTLEDIIRGKLSNSR